MVPIPGPATGDAERIDSFFGPMWFRADDHVMRPAVQRTGLWEPGETEVLRQLIKPGFRLLDVGAHIGYFSLVAHSTAPLVSIDAVEPDPFTARLCELNLFSAGADARIWTCGLGRQRGMVALDVADNNPGDTRVVPDRLTAKLLVPLVTADELFPSTRFDIVKVDVQGFERDVLLGMSALLRRNPQIKVLVEFFPKAITDDGGRPIDVLSEYSAMGFTVRTLVGAQVRDIAFDEIISLCSAAGPQGFVTLLLHRN